MQKIVSALHPYRHPTVQAPGLCGAPLAAAQQEVSFAGLRSKRESPFPDQDIKRISVQALEAVIREASAIQRKRHPFVPMSKDLEAVLNYEFNAEDILRLLPHRSYQEMQLGCPFQEPEKREHKRLSIRYLSDRYFLEDHMVKTGLWKESPAPVQNGMKHYTITPLALTKMGFDPETMKTRFATVNLTPIHDPVLAILKALVKAYEAGMKTFSTWFDSMREQCKMTHPFVCSVIDINEIKDSPQQIHFEDYHRQMIAEGWLQEHHYQPIPNRSHPVYEITDAGLARLKTPSAPTVT